MIATATQPTNNTMAPFCDYNAGILLSLDGSDHSTFDATEHQESRKVMAVMEMMASPLCKSVPDLDFDMDLFEHALRAENGAYSTSQKKTVRFAEYDQVKEIIHRDDMEPEDFDALYMSAEEQASARKSALNELIAVVRGHLLEDDEEGICIRGLENHMLENSQRFREAVNQLYDIVYDCQTFEDENGVQVPEEYLAQHMIQVSKVCQEEAYERAASDAFDARQWSAYAQHPS